MPIQNVNLPDRQARFVRARVKSGRYQNVSDVVRAGLRLLEQREAEDRARLKVLKGIAAEGFEAMDRGEFDVFSPAEMDAFVNSIGRRKRARKR